MSNYIIIITIPHGMCLNRSYGDNTRTCDLRAKEAADVLYEKLVLKGNYPTVFLSNIERHEHDLNRPWSRDVPWRIELTRTLNKLKNIKNNKTIILVDMHSFNYMGPIPSMKEAKIFGGKKVVLLDIEENIIVDNLIQKLSNILGVNSNGESNVGFIMGSIVNDIQITSRKYVDYSFLVENNENEKIYTKDELNKTMDILSDYLLTLPTITSPPITMKDEDNISLCNIL